MYGPVRSHQSDLLEPLRYLSSFEFNIYSLMYFYPGAISKLSLLKQDVGNIKIAIMVSFNRNARSNRMAISH